LNKLKKELHINDMKNIHKMKRMTLTHKVKEFQNHSVKYSKKAQNNSYFDSMVFVDTSLFWSLGICVNAGGFKFLSSHGNPRSIRDNRKYPN